MSAALRERNGTLSALWLDGAAAPAGTDGPRADLAGRSVLVMDAEDSFTAMWDHQLRSLGTTVTVRRFDERYDTDDFDLVLLGLDVIRRDRPDQGVQKKIDLFGRPELVGFYNTFAARADADLIIVPEIAGAVEVSRDPATAQVHALRARITADLLAGLLAETDSPSRPHPRSRG